MLNARALFVWIVTAKSIPGTDVMVIIGDIEELDILDDTINLGKFSSMGRLRIS